MYKPKGSTRAEGRAAMAQSQVSTKTAIATALRAAEASVTKTKAALDAATRELVSKAALAKLTTATRAAESAVSALRATQTLLASTRTPAAANTASREAEPTKQEPIRGQAARNHQGSWSAETGTDRGQANGQRRRCSRFETAAMTATSDRNGSAGLSASREVVRSAAKWFFAGLGGIGIVLVAGSQLSSIGALSPTSPRLYLALAGVVVGLGSILWAMWRVVDVLAGRRWAFEDVVREWKDVEQSPSQPFRNWRKRAKHPAGWFLREPNRRRDRHWCGRHHTVRLGRESSQTGPAHSFARPCESAQRRSAWGFVA
jgi:hypothetical protein